MNSKVLKNVETWWKKHSKKEKVAMSAVVVAIVLKLTYEFGYAVGQFIYYIQD